MPARGWSKRLRTPGACTPTATWPALSVRRSSCGPRAEAPDLRIEALESYAQSAELSGDLAEAARAWREICAAQGRARQPHGGAQAQRRLAAVHELRADRDAAFAARNAAAEAFAAEECLAEAAVERLALANYLRASANYSASIDLAHTAATDAERAGRLDLRLRALGIQGVAEAKGGDYERGVATVRGGLAQALEHDLTEVSADLYQRLSMVLYDGGDYARQTRCSITHSRSARRAPRAPRGVHHLSGLRTA